MKKIILTAGLFLSAIGSAQVTYFDPTTVIALNNYSDIIRNEQNKTNEELKGIKKAQALLTTQMLVVNAIQEDVRKGLTEIAGTVDNGFQVKNILKDLNYIMKYTGEVKDLVKENPAYAVFGRTASEQTWQVGTKLVAEMNDIITKGNLNLATAGDRHKVLAKIESHIALVRLWIYNLKTSIERAKRYGFWKSINPFQSHINTDKAIVQRIIDRYKRL